MSGVSVTDILAPRCGFTQVARPGFLPWPGMLGPVSPGRGPASVADSASPRSLWEVSSWFLSDRGSFLFPDVVMHFKIAFPFNFYPVVFEGDRGLGVHCLHGAHQKSQWLEKYHSIFLLPKSIFNRGKKFGKLRQR